MEKRKIRSKISKTSALAFKSWWFYSLMASQSYVLAHAFRQGKLSKEQIKKLPKDFDVVLKTYDDFGWVGNITFSDWLKQKDEVLFRTSKQIPMVSTITHIPRSDEGNFEKISDDISKYMYGTRSNQNYPHALILSIPVDMPQKHIAKQVAAKVKLYKQSQRMAKNPGIVEIPLYRFFANKLKTTAFRSSLKTLKTKIRNPEWPLWQVGTEIELNKAAAIEIRKAEAKRVDIVKATGIRPKPDESAYLDKMKMNTLVNRQIKYALLLAENAARGRFPCIDPIVDKNGKSIKLEMDYAFMQDQYEIAEAEFYKRYPKPEIV